MTAVIIKEMSLSKIQYWDSKKDDIPVRHYDFKHSSKKLTVKHFFEIVKQVAKLNGYDPELLPQRDEESGTWVIPSAIAYEVQKGLNKKEDELYKSESKKEQEFVLKEFPNISYDFRQGKTNNKEWFLLTIFTRENLKLKAWGENAKKYHKILQEHEPIKNFKLKCSGIMETDKFDGDFLLLKSNSVFDLVAKEEQLTSPSIESINNMGTDFEIIDTSSSTNQPISNLTIVTSKSSSIKKEEFRLDFDTIKKYIAPRNCTDQEIFMFIALCKHRKLNPFIQEAYLIKYGNSPAKMVISKYVFLKRAFAISEYEGLKAGIVVEDENGNTEKLEGSRIPKGKTLIGGWCEVYNKRFRVPLYAEVSFDDFNSPSSNPNKPNSWNKIPALMIRKVALVNALREAFPEDLGGLYIKEEMPKD